MADSQVSEPTVPYICAYLQTGTYCTHALFASQENLVYDMYNTINEQLENIYSENGT